MVHIYNEILLAIKKNEILPFGKTWIDLEVIMFSEISQTGKDQYHMISLTWTLTHKMKVCFRTRYLEWKHGKD